MTLGRGKIVADSPAVAQIKIINVRKHLYFMPVQRMGIFIPFTKRLPLLYRYTSIDKWLTFNNLAIGSPYGAIVYVKWAIEHIDYQWVKKKSKKMQKILDTS